MKEAFILAHNSRKKSFLTSWVIMICSFLLVCQFFLFEKKFALGSELGWDWAFSMFKDWWKSIKTIQPGGVVDPWHSCFEN